ncbi:hypothetical protein WN943_022792 [Citrus x changshan-huyou]
MINGGTSTAPSAPSGIHATVYEILFPVVVAYAIRHVAAAVSMAKVAISVFCKPISLFVLFFGALLGQDSITIAKLAAVFISMDGVAMTTVGKTWAVDEFLSASEEDKYGKPELVADDETKMAQMVCSPTNHGDGDGVIAEDAEAGVAIVAAIVKLLREALRLQLARERISEEKLNQILEDMLEGFFFP